MEVKKGYKQTEVGVIPDDWEEKNLGSLFEITSSKRVFQSEWKFEGVPFYRARELAVLGDLGRVDNELFISKEMYDEYARKYGVPNPGDMLVTGVGTLGKVYVVKGDHDFYFKDGNIIWFKIGDVIFSEFLRQLYLTPLISRQISDGSAGTTVGTYTISGAKKTLIPLPPLPEQRAIAEALGDVDALVGVLEKLIAKKRALKQAAMQELLTGKKRLPGFGGEWELKRLGDVINYIVGGGTPSRSNYDYWGGDIPWVTVKDFETFNPYCTQETITREGLKNSATHLIPKGIIIIGTRMALGKAVIYEVDVSINQDLKALFPSEGLDTKFLYYWFQMKADFINGLGSGSTVKGISLSDLKNIRILYPSFSEQTAIATVLSDMDTEIETLDKRLEKTRVLKQGMMQELLSGKTRIIEN